MKKILSFRNLKTLSICAAYCFLIICFSACTKTNDSSPQISYSNIAGVNATENNFEDFYINNSRANVGGLNPGDVAGYFSVLPTTNTVDFRLNGSITSVTGTGSIDCTADKFYTAFLGDGNFVLTMEDDRTPPQTGKARIRFINMSTYLTGAVDFGPTGGNKTISGIAQKTTYGYFEVDPSITSISVYNTGASTPIFNTTVALQAGHVYIFYISGTTNGTLKGKLLTQI